MAPAEDAGVPVSHILRAPDGPLLKSALMLLMVLAPLLAFIPWEAAAQTRFMHMRGQTVHPAYEGWERTEGGTYLIHFGYMNSNWEEVFHIPVGPDNYFSLADSGVLNDMGRDAFEPATADLGQPTHFQPQRNPFLFTVEVPADFGEQELVWTLRSHGVTRRAYATLLPDYAIDPHVISTTIGGAFGSLDDRLRTNLAPELDVEGPSYRTVRVGESMTLVAHAHDPDHYPPFVARRAPDTLAQLYSQPGSVVVSSAPGMRLSWIVYRGVAEHVSFSPVQLKTWMDTRVWSNSPWSPPYVLPAPPEDGRWETVVRFDAPGEYVLRAVASDGGVFTYDNVSVTVVP